MEMGKYTKVNFIDACDIVAGFKVRAIQVGVPDENNIDIFERFIEEMLAPLGINHILLCLDYRFKFKTHPDITDEPATSYEIAKRVSSVCHRNSIKVIPVTNVLAHQTSIFNGWEPKGLFRSYPDMEEKFDGELHSTKCLCTRHPKVRPIMFDIISELMEAFDTRDIHVGLDEVWDIGKCPRCKNVPEEILFSEYINDIYGHITANNGKMWIWGDRLIDGHLVPNVNAGYETCLSDMYKAVDIIPKDIVICDWHYYDEPFGQLSPSYWAMKGFDYIGCVFNSINGTDQMLYATRVVQSPKTLGTMLTTWCKLEAFIDEVWKLYPEYLKSGTFEYNKSLEDSGIDKARHFAYQAACMFMKMYVKP